VNQEKFEESVTAFIAIYTSLLFGLCPVRDDAYYLNYDLTFGREVPTARGELASLKAHLYVLLLSIGTYVS
jgi:hypothetical protein